MQDLLGKANLVEKATDRMCDIPKAARASGWSVVDVVRALLAGSLHNIECVDPELRFLGVLVDPIEVSAVLRQDISDDLVSFDEAASLLGIKRYGVRKFLDLRDQTGQSYLSVRSIPNAEGRQLDFLSRTEIAAFLESHVSLVQIAGQMDCHARLAKTRLAADNIIPINDSSGIGRTFYRREEVSEFSVP